LHWLGFINPYKAKFLVEREVQIGNQSSINSTSPHEPTGIQLNYVDTVAALIPELSTMLLLGAGLAGFDFVRRRIKK
jgi:hypothetical protein